MFTSIKNVVLASGSPRRQQYFKDLGLAFSIKTAEIDENPYPFELPRVFVERMAREKAQAVMNGSPDAWVVGADTVVTIDDNILGKPKNGEDAVNMLLSLSGRTHRVLTGLYLGCRVADTEVCQSVESKVTFIDFDEVMIRAYVSTGESLDKAGAYGIQGKGAFLVECISGSYSNIVGLPLAELVQLFLEHGVVEAA